MHQYLKDLEMNELMARRQQTGLNEDRFRSSVERNMYVRDGVLGTPPVLLTPTRLYDNPDYADLRRKSRQR